MVLPLICLTEKSLNIPAQTIQAGSSDRRSVLSLRQNERTVDNHLHMTSEARELTDWLVCRQACRVRPLPATQQLAVRMFRLAHLIFSVAASQIDRSGAGEARLAKLGATDGLAKSSLKLLLAFLTSPTTFHL